MAFFKKRKKAEMDLEHLPQHIAIIMDGNGRWAKKRGMKRSVGHKAGAETFKNTVLYCRDIGIKYLTVYAFSTENWKRPKDEVDAICDLLRSYISEVRKQLGEENVRILFLGDLSAFDEDLQQDMKRLMAECPQDAKMTVNIAVNYGGRLELTQAMQEIAKEVESGKVWPAEIDEEMISRHLYTRDQPDPDLLIRPSGELRLSNFLLWQVAYAEFWFSDVLWPDFRPEHLQEAIVAYQKRNRRYGGI